MRLSEGQWSSLKFSGALWRSAGLIKSQGVSVEVSGAQWDMIVSHKDSMRIKEGHYVSVGLSGG